MWRLQRARPWSRWTLVVKMSEDEVEVIVGSVLSSCSKEAKCLPFGQQTQITLICMLLSYPSNMMRSKTPWEDCPGRSVQCKQNMVSNMRTETRPSVNPPCPCTHPHPLSNRWEPRGGCHISEGWDKKKGFPHCAKYNSVHKKSNINSIPNW